MTVGDEFRPSAWDDYVGQEALKRELQIRIDASIAEGRPLGHVLLDTTPGAGKTSLAHLIADRLEQPFESVVMPISTKALHSLVRQHEGVVLMDELHRASVRQQEELLPLLLDGYVQLPSGRRLYADWLTIIGATTEPQKLIAPLIERFEITPFFEDYSDEELTLIVTLMAEKAKLELAAETALALGKAAAGVPRRARKFVLAYRDLASGSDQSPSAQEVLDLCRTAPDGLTIQHEQYLSTLDSVGGTAGLRVLCSLLRMNESVVTDLERVLIKRGFITLEERGRTLTRPGFNRARATNVSAAA